MTLLAWRTAVYPNPAMSSVVPVSPTPHRSPEGPLNTRPWLCVRGSGASAFMPSDGDGTRASCTGCVQRVWAQCLLCVSLYAVILTGEKRLAKVVGNTCFSVTVMQLLVLYFHVTVYPPLPEIFAPYFMLAAVVSPLHLFSVTLLLGPPHAEVMSWFRRTSQNSWNIVECR